MAPISKTIVLAALAAVVCARPLNVARQQEVVTETDWVEKLVPVTLWVDQNGIPLSTVAEGGNFAAIPTTFSTSSVAPVVSSASASVASTIPTVTSTIPKPSVPSQAPVQAPVQTPSPSTSLAPTTSYVPVATHAPTSSYVEVTSTSKLGRADATPAAAAGGNTGVSASTTNMCTGTGDACVGDITHYDGGLGACGWNVNTASDMQIALPVGFMGSASNNNPYCGKSLTIMNPTTGQTISATVGDKCMGCTGRSIDLTDALFNAIGGGCDGRCSGFEWWFN